MSSARNPWMKFYPSDWRADQALRICSIAARGLWVELMCIMHEAEPYGHLVVNGVPVTETQIGLLTGIPSVEVGALLTELETAGVFSRNRDGVIYSRRMTRDERKRSDGKKSAKQGTLPNSRRGRQRGEKQAQNQPPIRVVSGVESEPPPHPEARGQIPDREKEEANASSKKPGSNGPKKTHSGKSGGTAIPLSAFGVGTDQGSADPAPPDPPPKADKGKPSKSDKRGSRLAQDWEPSDADRAYAQERGFDPGQIDDLAEGFRDYWLSKPGKGGVKLDWSRTWHTWVRNDIKFHAEPQTRANAAGQGSMNGVPSNVQRLNQPPTNGGHRNQGQRKAAFLAGAFGAIDR